MVEELQQVRVDLQVTQLLQEIFLHFMELNQLVVEVVVIIPLVVQMVDQVVELMDQVNLEVQVILHQ